MDNSKSSVKLILNVPLIVLLVRMTTIHDVIIVGAGIAGLHCARRLLEEKPHLNVLMLEKYNYIGGRVVTFHPPEFPGVHWENGAGRIHSSHKMVMSYMHKYGLTFIPISDDIWVQREDNGPLIKSKFVERLTEYLMPIHCLPDSVLSTHTLERLLVDIVGKRKTHDLLGEFPYRAEVNTLRADEAIDRLLATDDVVADGFGVCAEGLDRLIDGMVNDVVSANASILLGHSVEHLVQSDGIHHVECSVKGKMRTFSAKKVILALHINAMKHISGLEKWPLLKQLAMRPLLRVYAIFPGESWFDQRKIVFVNNPIRYFIPIDASRGICMLSYTDADDTQTWMKDAMGDSEKLQERMMKAIRRAFPMRRIPDPIYFKTHPWTDGCTYWLPVAKATTTPATPAGPHKIYDGVYACGESFSLDKQCWMEGALESAEDLVKHITAHKFTAH
jgi:monoamine oxidase